MALTDREFDRIAAKLGMEVREGKHRVALLRHEGKVVVKTMRSQGRGELGPVEHSIRRQLHVSQEQLRMLADCPMSKTDYLKNLSDRGVI